VAIGLVGTLPLAAQAPAGWYRNAALGAEQPKYEPWYGAGLWAGDHHGPAATLVDSAGLGNALVGGGFHLEAGFRGDRWDVAAELLGNRDTGGKAYMTLYRSHIWYRSVRGWQGGFEQEPLVWGYGLNGGYLLGEAARPFPRLRVQSPMADLHVGRVPLGRWGWQMFMGRLENHRQLSSSIQDRAWRSRAIAGQGDVQAPMFAGYRAEARFGPLMELYLSYTNLWAGTLNGQGMTSGYGIGDYLTAITGLKDTLAESNVDFSDPSHPQGAVYRNKARSASEAEVGFRMQLPGLARSLSAETFHVYLSRGSKAVVWPVAILAKRPVQSIGTDLSNDFKDLTSLNAGAVYNRGHYTAPNLAVPNDTLGVLATWPRVRLGLEYFNGINGSNQGHRTFAHGQYLSGFYTYGDPLGNATGGEACTTTVKLELDLAPGLGTRTWIIRGFRPFRDNLDDWIQDHPGQAPAKNRMFGLQQAVAWKVNPVTTLDVGASWSRQEAVDNVRGQRGNGFAWFTDLAFRWPRPSRLSPGWQEPRDIPRASTP
jgi:hypothetical protein